MANGYTRQSAANIQAGLPIQSGDINTELNQVQTAFDITTGHDHSGSAAGTGAKISLATAVTSVLPLANGGSNAALTASTGGILYSGASALAILAGTATAKQLLTSGANAAPTWSNISSLLTAGTGITITGTTNATIALTTPVAVANGGTGVTTSTGTGSVVLSAGAALTGTVSVTNVVAANTTIQANAPTLTVASSTTILAAGYSASIGVTNKDTTQNWYFGVNDDDTKALYIGRGYGSHQGIAPAIKITTSDVVSLANPLAVASGGSGGTTAATAYANIAVKASSIAANGYIQYTNNLVDEWGKATILNGNNSVAVVFPFAFPTAVFSIVLGGGLAAANTIDYGISQAVGVTTTGFTINCSTNAGVGGLDVYWRAVGN